MISVLPVDCIQERHRRIVGGKTFMLSPPIATGINIPKAIYVRDEAAC
jgi:hypothetical protein